MSTSGSTERDNERLAALFFEIETLLPEAIRAKLAEVGEEGIRSSDLEAARRWLSDYEKVILPAKVEKARSSGKVLPFQAVTTPEVDEREVDTRKSA